MSRLISSHQVYEFYANGRLQVAGKRGVYISATTHLPPAGDVRKAAASPDQRRLKNKYDINAQQVHKQVHDVTFG